MKKDNDNEAEIVDKLDDVYKVGTFAQILELQDLGDKLRMVVVAHRRIKITGQILEELVPPKGKLLVYKCTLQIFIIYFEVTGFSFIQ